MTSGPLCLEKVTLDPSQLFEVTALNEVEGEEDAEAKTASVFGKVNCLRPQDSRQYLYCLTPRPEVKANHRLMKGVTNIGKLFNVYTFQYLKRMVYLVSYHFFKRIWPRTQKKEKRLANLSISLFR